MLTVQSTPASLSSNLLRRPSFSRNDSRTTVSGGVPWSPSPSIDGSPPVESLLMVAPTDSPVYAQTETCDQCGYYVDSNGQQVYSVDYVRYWDCCGASTGSIESKVEQALDLVKNHLMFAVREEIRALKDELEELIRKNERLEYENNVLRRYASPDTLARINTTTAAVNGTDMTNGFLPASALAAHLKLLTTADVESGDGTSSTLSKEDEDDVEDQPVDCGVNDSSRR